jgi:hypothetical protein
MVSPFHLFSSVRTRFSGLLSQGEYSVLILFLLSDPSFLGTSSDFRKVMLQDFGLFCSVRSVLCDVFSVFSVFCPIAAVVDSMAPTISVAQALPFV